MANTWAGKGRGEWREGMGVNGEGVDTGESEGGLKQSRRMSGRERVEVENRGKCTGAS